MKSKIYPIRIKRFGWPVFLLTSGAWLSLVLLSGCSSETESPKGPPTSWNQVSPTERLVRDLIINEDTVLDLSPRMGKIAKWMEQVSADPEGAHPEQPDLQTLENVTGLKGVLVESLFQSAHRKARVLEVVDWPLESESDSVQNPWGPLVTAGVRWETVKFGVLSGLFEGPLKSDFVMELKAEGRGFDKQGRVYGFKAKQKLFWKRKLNSYTLVQWQQKELHLKRASEPMFEEVLATTIADPGQLELAQRSYHDEIIIRASIDGEVKLPTPEHEKWTSVTSNHYFPSVSVVDYDNDGFDDLFVTARWGPTQLLRNQGDGTFVDVADEVGLRFPYLVNCAIFFDVDNDGDCDALLGRAMETALYLRNDHGKFSDVTASHSDLGEQYFISAFAVNDVNRDGLLDVYLSSYPPLNRTGNMPFENDFLGDEEMDLFLQHREGSDPWLNLAGSANVLLMNRGNGRLERVPFDECLSQWRRSFQSTWGDFDQDGDDDLYVCNDFAPDAFLRNDTVKGTPNPVFTDITDEMQGGIQGSAMGGSWGDFDQDGDLDLYVSNMFSKAGTRIVNFIGGADERIEASTKGNFLFENRDGKMVQVAGSAPGQHAVHQVGWAYGGQWADWDNNGFLDLYCPTGFYTAPKQISSQVDT
jgi:hypothetical protein